MTTTSASARGIEPEHTGTSHDDVAYKQNALTNCAIGKEINRGAAHQLQINLGGGGLYNAAHDGQGKPAAGGAAVGGGSVAASLGLTRMASAFLARCTMRAGSGPTQVNDAAVSGGG